MNYPRFHSDIDCRTCGEWFHTTCDLVTHIEQAHPEEDA